MEVITRKFLPTNNRRTEGIIGKFTAIKFQMLSEKSKKNAIKMYVNFRKLGVLSATLLVITSLLTHYVPITR